MEKQGEGGENKGEGILERAARTAMAWSALGLFILGLICVAGMMWAFKMFLDATV